MTGLGTFKSISASWCRLRLLKTIFGKKQHKTKKVSTENQTGC